MLSNKVMVFVFVTFIGGVILSACAVAPTSRGPSQSNLSLTAPQTSKPLSKEIESFMVTLTNDGSADAEVDVSLDTVRGATWRAALCYEEFCFFHNGKDALHHTLPLAGGEVREFEIKLFLPKTVQPGEGKTLKVEAASVDNLAASASVEFEGFVP